MGQSTVERLDRFLSNAGLASRKDVKRLLKQAVVTVNGKRVTSSGNRIDSKRDIIRVNEVQIHKKEHVYLALNKPKDVVSTTRDPRGRTTVVDLIATTERIYPIGRLDKDTHGLLLLTTDGELTHALIHPKYHVPKLYRITASEHPSEAQLRTLATGVLLSDGITLPADVRLIAKKNAGTCTIEITLREGRYRQVRRMCETVGIELLDLQRIQFGPIHIGDLPEGKSRELTKKEVDELRLATKR